VAWASWPGPQRLDPAVSLCATLGLSLLVSGCSAAPSEPASLIDHALWTGNLSVGDDPFDDRPDEVDCSELSHGLETTGGEDNLEVDTTRCNYLTVSQPSLAPVRVGDSLHLRLWHFDLTAAEPAEAHVAIQIGDQVLWETLIEIPAEATLLSPRWAAADASDEGQSLYFHLHNHGQNSWNFIELTVGGS